MKVHLYATTKNCHSWLERAYMTLNCSANPCPTPSFQFPDVRNRKFPTRNHQIDGLSQLGIPTEGIVSPWSNKAQEIRYANTPPPSQQSPLLGRLPAAICDCWTTRPRRGKGRHNTALEEEWEIGRMKVGMGCNKSHHPFKSLKQWLQYIGITFFFLVGAGGQGKGKLDLSSHPSLGFSKDVKNAQQICTSSSGNLLKLYSPEN